MKTFECKLCGDMFNSPTRGCALHCEKCKRKAASIRDARYRKKKNPESMVGVGSGGNQRGENNHEWKGGTRTYSKLIDSDCCEICGHEEDLHTHHKDFDHGNNDPINLQRLCRSCHAKVHDFASHFL